MSMIPTVGLNHYQDTELNGGTPISTWYIGLINNSPSPSLAAGDTLASHAGWVETAAYAGNRKAWTQGASSGGVVTNASAVDFVMNAGLSVYGTFGCSVATGTTGPLLWTAAFTGGVQAVSNGDTLHVTHSITAASA